MEVQMARRFFVSGPDDGDDLGYPNGKGISRATSEDTDGAMTLVEFEHEASLVLGQGEHSHTFAEVYFVLRGSYQFCIDGEVLDAPAGTLAFIPPGVPHGPQRSGPEGGRITAWHVRGEGRLESTAELAARQKEALAAMRDSAKLS
jgi:quercetin dioxygenase-like cupin family protein